MKIITSIFLLSALFLTANAQKLTIPNHDFESNVLNYFGSPAKITTDTPHSGKQALNHLSGTLQMKPPYIPVKPDTWYRVRVWNRTTAMSGGIQFGIRQCYSTDPTTKSILYNWFDVKTNALEWREYVREFKTAPEAHGISIYFKRGEDVIGGDVFYDDISIEEFIPEPVLLTAEPYKPVVTFTSGKNMLMIRQKGVKNSWQEYSPADEKFIMHFHEKVKGENISLKISGRYDGKVYFTKTIKVPDTLKHEQLLPIATLKEGSYLLTVDLKDQGLLTKNIIRLPQLNYGNEKPEPIQEASCDTDGTFLVNGKPFFPVYYSHYYYDPETAGEFRNQLGANVISAWADVRDGIKKPVEGLSDQELIGYYTNAYAILADKIGNGGFYAVNAMGMPGILNRQAGEFNVNVLKAVVEKLKNHPYSFIWNIIDEPDINNISPATAENAFAVVKETDPGRIFWINLCAPNRFKEYANCGEIASFDFYALPNDSLKAFMARMLQLKSVFKQGAPLISYLQAYNPPGIRLPSFDEFRSMMYLNLIANSKSFICYSFVDPVPTQCIISDAEFQGYVKATVSEFYRMHDFMAAKSSPQPDLNFDDGIFYLQKKTDTNIILVVVNTSFESKSLNWKIDSVDAACSVRFENRTLTGNNGIFTDSIAPNESHVYSFKIK